MQALVLDEWGRGEVRGEGMQVFWPIGRLREDPGVWELDF